MLVIILIMCMLQLSCKVRSDSEPYQFVPKERIKRVAEGQKTIYSIRVPEPEGYEIKNSTNYVYNIRPSSSTQNNNRRPENNNPRPENNNPKPEKNPYVIHNSAASKPYTTTEANINEFSENVPDPKPFTRPAYVYGQTRKPPSYTNGVEDSGNVATSTSKPRVEPEIGQPIKLSTTTKHNIISIRRENIYKIENAESVEEEKSEYCEVTVTTYNGKDACQGQLIFKDDFDNLNPKKWKHDIIIPTKPDYEFVAFIQSANNTFINDGVLHIKPTLTEEIAEPSILQLGEIFLTGCSPNNVGFCKKKASAFNILPPVLSSRMKTSANFYFRYGRVEIRAKLPAGDWIFPELYLEPKDNEYGPGYLSGRIVMGLIRSNEKVVDSKINQEIGSKLLSVGCLYRTGEDFTENFPKYMNKMNEIGWNQDFRNYSVVWTPEYVEFYVDGESLGRCKLPTGKLQRLPIWQKGTPLAPFDKEFSITIGLGAGGIREFPDNIISENNEAKPWKNTGSKNVLTFWQAKEMWYKTWNEDSHLQVDSVKVYAL